MSDFIDTEKKPQNGQNEHETIKRTTLIPLGIFAFIVAIWAIIKLSQLYVSPADNTKAAIDGILALLTLAVIVVQSVIIQRQWQAMQDALQRTDRLLEQNERSIEAAQRQAVASEQSIELTRQMYYEGQRAYLTITAIELEHLAPDKIRLQTVIRNNGRTPAWNATQLYRIAILTPPVDNEPPDWPPPTREQVIRIIVPEQPQNLRGQIIDLPEFDQIKSGEKLLIATWKVDYLCILDRKECMISHHIYDPIENVFVNRSEWPFGDSSPEPAEY